MSLLLFVVYTLVSASVVLLFAGCDNDNVQEKLISLEQQLNSTTAYQEAVHSALDSLYPAVLGAGDANLDSLYNKVTLQLLVRGRLSGSDRLIAAFELLSKSYIGSITYAGSAIAQMHRLGFRSAKGRSALVSALLDIPSQTELANLSSSLAMFCMQDSLNTLAYEQADCAKKVFERQNELRGAMWPTRLKYAVLMRQGRISEAENVLDTFRLMFENFSRIDIEDFYTTSVNLAHDVYSFPTASSHEERAFGTYKGVIRRMHDSLLTQTNYRPWLIGRMTVGIDTSTRFPRPIIRELRNEWIASLTADSVTYTSSNAPIIHNCLGSYAYAGATWRLMSTSELRRASRQRIVAASASAPIRLHRFNTMIQNITCLGGDTVFVATKDSLFIVIDSLIRGLDRSDFLPGILRDAHVRELNDTLFMIISDQGVHLLDTRLAIRKKLALTTNVSEQYQWRSRFSLRRHDSRIVSDGTLILSTSNGEGAYTFNVNTLELLPQSSENMKWFESSDALNKVLSSAGIGADLVQWYPGRIQEEQLGFRSQAVLGSSLPFLRKLFSTSLYDNPTCAEPYHLLVRGSFGLIVDTAHAQVLPLEDLPVVTSLDDPALSSLSGIMSVSVSPRPTVFFADGTDLRVQRHYSSWIPLKPSLVIEDVTANRTDTITLSAGRNNYEVEQGHEYLVYTEAISPAFGYVMSTQLAPHAPDYFGDPDRGKGFLAHFHVGDHFTSGTITIPYCDSRWTFNKYVPLYKQTWFIGLLGAGGAASFLFSLLTIYRNTARRRADAIEEARQQQLLLLREDMHDMIGSRLSRIASLARRTDTPDQTDRLRRINEIALTTVRSLRNLLSLMSETSITDPEFFGSIKEFMVGTCQDAGLTCVATIDVEDASHLTSESRHQLIMICSELVTNSVRHAACFHTWMHVTLAKHHYILTWEDDGVGIDPAKPRGHGLNNIQRRCSRLGATVEFTSRQPNGTIVRISVPVHHHT